MQFLPKWAQNVSKFILFHKWTTIFKLNINFQFCTNFYVSEMFLPISQNSYIPLKLQTEKKKKKKTLTAPSLPHFFFFFFASFFYFRGAGSLDFFGSQFKLLMVLWVDSDGRKKIWVQFYRLPIMHDWEALKFHTLLIHILEMQHKLKLYQIIKLMRSF